MNIQKSVAFLYTNNELSEREIKETVPFTITSKRASQVALVEKNQPANAGDTRGTVLILDQEDPLE